MQVKVQLYTKSESRDFEIGFEMKQILIFDAFHFGLSHDDSPLSWDIQTSHLLHCHPWDFRCMSHVLPMGHGWKLLVCGNVYAGCVDEELR